MNKGNLPFDNAKGLFLSFFIMSKMLGTMLICAYTFFQFLGICSAYVLVSGNWSTSAILMHWKGRFLDFGDLRELLLWV